MFCFHEKAFPARFFLTHYENTGQPAFWVNVFHDVYLQPNGFFKP